MSYPYTLIAFDVRKVDQPETSRVRIISKMTLPSIKRKKLSFTPGGGIGQIDIALPQIEPLEAKFETRGPDLGAFAAVGLVAGERSRWIFAGALRQKSGGEAVSLRAIIEGSVSEIEAGAASVGEAMDFTHVIQEIVHYELHIGDQEIFYFDFEELEGRSNGISWYADIRKALGIS